MANYLKIVFVIDESGSMSGSNDDVIGGFNSYIDTQRKETKGKVTVSLYKFNHEVSRVIHDKPIKDIKDLSTTDYIPGGFTALYDAIGKAIHDTDKQITNQNDNKKPDSVMFVIITDGQENSSKEFSSQALKTLIATHEDLLKWYFVYLGSGLNDFSDADHLGLKYRATSQKINLQSNFNSVAESTVLFRRCDDNNMDETISFLMKDLDDKK
ncbi:MAG: vWA domain-containing protein [Bacteroidales bacterium]